MLAPYLRPHYYKNEETVDDKVKFTTRTDHNIWPDIVVDVM
jgi:hypothetical protein